MNDVQQFKYKDMAIMRPPKPKMKMNQNIINNENKKAVQQLYISEAYMKRDIRNK